ncbi:MAG: c-type cytochrome, partial [Planctomycetes bacterium]|nr:c-type cytochrome [Planctomycetota bacterium]
LEDTTGDGELDKATTFLDGLILPRAVAVTRDGCLYTSGDALYFIKRKGLKPVGLPLTVDAEYAKGGNPEHKANGLLYGHDNWYYNAKSSSRYQRVNGSWVRETTNFRGQWGITKDNAGRLYHNSNSTLLVGEQFRPQFFRGPGRYVPKASMASRLGSNRVYPIRITPGLNRAYQPGLLGDDGKLINATATCGVHIYRGDNFPESMQGMAFACEPGAELVKAIHVDRSEWNEPSGSHPFGTKEFLATKDEWFLPCNLYTAPDGTLWVLDMYFGLLQHKAYMTTYLRKQYSSRGLDKPKASTGRIYRIRYKARAASPVPQMDGLDAVKLVVFLGHPNGQVRDTAQRLIVESGDRSVAMDLEGLVVASKNPLAQIHAMWTLDGLKLQSNPAFLAALKSPDSDVATTALDIISLRRIQGRGIRQAVAEWTPKPQELHSYIRALAAMGLMEQAIETLALHGDSVKLLREAIVTGLGQDVTDFDKAHGQVKDKDLAQLISAAMEATRQLHRVAVNHLQPGDQASFERGKKVYSTKAACSSCHGLEGSGLPNLGPTLVQSEWVLGDPSVLTKILLHGLSGPIQVNGDSYAPPLSMPGFAANASIQNQDLADVMTFVRNSWGNKANPVFAKAVQVIRHSERARKQPYTAAELSM